VETVGNFKRHDLRLLYKTKIKILSFYTNKQTNKQTQSPYYW